MIGNFQGERLAEEAVKLLVDLINVFPKQAQTFIAKIDVKQTIKINRSGTQITIIATNAFKQTGVFHGEVSKLIELADAIGILGAEINKFLDVAFSEGMQMAVDSIVEFYLTKRSGRGPKRTQGKGKGNKKSRKPKCTPGQISHLNREMHRHCDKKRSCSEQIDACATATTKVAAGMSCIRARTELQQKCFTPGEPGYKTHMQQIAEAYAALRECERVMSLKCRN